MCYPLGNFLLNLICYTPLQRNQEGEGVNFDKIFSNWILPKDIIFLEISEFISE